MFGFNKNLFQRSAVIFLAASSLHLGSSVILFAQTLAPTQVRANATEKMKANIREVSGKIADSALPETASGQEALETKTTEPSIASSSPTAGPVDATSETAPTEKNKALEDVQVGELENLFIDFHAVREEGSEDPAHYTLYGLIFADCLTPKAGFQPKFQIFNSKHDAFSFPDKRNLTKHIQTGDAGFRINDPGQLVRGCMAEHIKNHDICEEAGSCVALDRLPGATMILSQEEKDLKIGLGYHDKNASRPQTAIVWNDFETAIPTYKGTASRANDEFARKTARASASAQKQENREKLLLAQAKSCRKTSDDRIIGLAAAETLGELGLKTADEVEKYQKEILRAELVELAAALSKAKLTESGDIDEAVAALKEFAANNPADADKVASLLHQKAAQITKGAHTPEAFERADSLISDAKDIGGISDATALALDNDHLGIQVGRYEAMARSGNTDPYQFWNGYSSMMYDLKSQVSQCYSGGNSASCNGTMQAFSAATKIPQMAQQAAYDRQMFQSQMQKQMAAAFGQGGGQYSQPSNVGTWGSPGGFGVSPFSPNLGGSFTNNGPSGGGNMAGQNGQGAPGGGSPFFQ